MDQPATKADLDAAVEQIRTEMEQRLELLRTEMEHRFEVFQHRIETRIATAERDIIRSVNRYFAALSIALISAFGAGAAAVILGG